MKLTIIGCSDAFSSGGRNHSCYLLDTSQGRLMIDCGSNSPLALKRAGIKLSSIDAILISHCHGDHFGGLPFVFLDKMFLEPGPVEVIGPPGIEARSNALFECMYPGLLGKPGRLEVSYSEMRPGGTRGWRGIPIASFETNHLSGSPSLAISVTDEARRFSFSGDSGWCDAIGQAGAGADLFLIECTTFHTKTGMHLDYLTLATKFDEIGAAKYLLTHMSKEMLSSAAEVDTEKCLLAEDGLTITV